jgi:hypothetical protein
MAGRSYLLDTNTLSHLVRQPHGSVSPHSWSFHARRITHVAPMDLPAGSIDQTSSSEVKIWLYACKDGQRMALNDARSRSRWSNTRPV